MARDAIFNPRKREYEKAHLRVRVRVSKQFLTGLLHFFLTQTTLEAEYKNCGFEALAKHPAHAKAYDAAVKSQCSSVLCQFRKAVSVF